MLRGAFNVPSMMADLVFAFVFTFYLESSRHRLMRVGR